MTKPVTRRLLARRAAARSVQDLIDPMAAASAARGRSRCGRAVDRDAAFARAIEPGARQVGFAVLARDQAEHPTAAAVAAVARGLHHPPTAVAVERHATFSVHRHATEQTARTVVLCIAGVS